MDKTILIVDDDKKLNGLLEDIFESEGYSVITAYDGEEAIKIMEARPYIPLVVLDVMLPEFDGWQVLSYIKEHFDAKVIMLTAVSDEYSEAKGLRNGADDYVIKPFKRAALIERVKKLMGSFRKENNSELICGELKVLQKEMKVYLSEEEIKLMPKEYQLLVYLMKNNLIVLERDMILEKIWGFEYTRNNRTVDTHIKMLRHSLGEYGEKIRTVRGIGYSFEGEVTEI